MKAAVVLRWEQKNGCSQLSYRIFYLKVHSENGGEDWGEKSRRGELMLDFLQCSGFVNTKKKQEESPKRCDSVLQKAQKGLAKKKRAEGLLEDEWPRR